MSQFAVIKVDVVDPNEGYITGVDCMHVYPTKEEAEAYITGIYESRLYARNARNQRIDAFIETIQVPTTTTYQEWSDFIGKYGFLNLHHITKDNFKNELRHRMVTGHPVTGFFDFGRTDCSNNDLHVVEIKESK